MTSRPEPVIEPDLGPSGSGTVVLDIGGDIGAAVVYVDDALADTELEIRRVGERWTGRHTGVRRRETDVTTWAAVFPALNAGDYEIRVMGAAAPQILVPLTVSGGSVTSLGFPT